MYVREYDANQMCGRSIVQASLRQASLLEVAFRADLHRVAAGSLLFAWYFVNSKEAVGVDAMSGGSCRIPSPACC